MLQRFFNISPTRRIHAGLCSSQLVQLRRRPQQRPHPAGSQEVHPAVHPSVVAAQRRRTPLPRDLVRLRPARRLLCPRVPARDVPAVRARPFAVQQHQGVRQEGQQRSAADLRRRLPTFHVSVGVRFVVYSGTLYR